MLKQTLTAVCILSFTVLAFAQYGDPEYRAKDRMDQNLIRTTFYNYGLIGNIGEISFEWPNGTGNEYGGDFIPLLAAEFVHPSGDTLHSVITGDGPRGNPDGPPGGGAFWGFEPIPGFANWPPPGPLPVVAISDRPETWPDEWNGRWCGANGFGTIWGGLETYFQMDDHRDMEWRERNGHILYPFPNDTSRGGIGLRVEVRYMQFNTFGSDDALILMYILHNDGQVVINHARFGFVAGTLAGGRQDSEDDLTSHNADLDLVFTYDSDDQGSPGWVPVSESHNVGYFGTMFMKTPEDQGLTSLDVFTPPGAVRMNNDQALWENMTPGHFEEEVIPTDCDYIMATGDFSLLPGTADTVIAAVLFGEDYADLVGNADELMQLYESGTIMNADPQPIVHKPEEWSLLPAYPNPFNSLTTIRFILSNTAITTLDVFGLTGRSVMCVDYGLLSSGEHHCLFDASGLPSGVYLYRVTAGTSAQSGKLVFLN